MLAAVPQPTVESDRWRSRLIKQRKPREILDWRLSRKAIAAREAGEVETLAQRHLLQLRQEGLSAQLAWRHSQEREAQAQNFAKDRERHLKDYDAACRLREEILLNEKPGDRLIRVMTAFNQASGYRPQTFVLADVESVACLEAGRSAIVLRSGAEIPVALPYRELERQTYRPDYSHDDPVLDLRAVTGEVAKPKAPRIWG